jgi:outer membrane lipoprotein SlyB
MLMWIVGIAVILFSVAGIAAIMGWIPTSMGQPGDSATLVPVDKVSTAPAKPVAKARPAPVIVASNTVSRHSCADCGVIESTRVVTTKGEGSGIGAVGGAVVGGLLGNQVGGGSGKTVATAVGAVGGVIAGNEIEKRVNTTKSYEVTVRLNNGSSRVFSEANLPSWRNGEQVKIVDGVIRANP